LAEQNYAFRVSANFDAPLVNIAVVFHSFGPYHSARLRAASRFCEAIAIELVAETSEYAWSRVQDITGVKRLTLFPEGDPQANSAGEISRRMRQALSSCAPDAVAIPGWSNKGAMAALSWCALTRTPAILMSESTAQDEPRFWWREAIKRRIVNVYSTALVGGQRHIEYLAGLGMPRNRIFIGYDVVDNGYFARSANEVRGQRSEVRQKYGLPENYFLASARFIEKKNLFTLLRAYATYRHNTGDNAWKLILLGDGPLKSDLCRLISDLRLCDSVLMPGFKQYDELPGYYALANAFVHASTTEQWGLVVNEAMASGLPVIVSNRCGCVPELVREGVNGFTFDPDNAGQLGELMLRLSKDSQLPAMGNASRNIISDWGTEQFGTGLKAAAETALKMSLKRPNLLQRVLLRLLVYG
jgi:1,2-diacylglycerol 3-alpha-glucosyltransferase